MLIRTGSRSRPTLWTLLVPLLAVAALYAPGFGGWWLGDDLANLHQLYGWEQQGRLWTETWRKFGAAVDPQGAFYRPVMMLALALNYVASGASYASWFAVNLTLHLANTLLVGLLAHRLAAHCACDARVAAPLAAAWFGLSPMLAEGVFWLSARADACVVLLTLLATWLWAGRAGARPGLAATTAPLLLLVALGFKESAAVYPLQLALVWLAWPPRTTPAQRFAVVACFGAAAAFLALRAWLVGSAWQVYGETPQGGLLDAIGSLPEWWLALSAPARWAGLAYAAAAIVALVVAPLGTRGAQARLVLALIAASGGLALATLLNLGALSGSGEGGRLSYAPLAWLAIGFGLALARGRRVLGRHDRARPAAAFALALATLAGAWVLHAQLREVRAAQDELRALAGALPGWSAEHPGLTLLLLPERRGAVVTGRNAQGALALPPIQATGLLHRVLPTLPGELALRQAQLAGGLAARLEAVRPQWIDAATLRSLLQTAAPRDPEHLACWSRSLRRVEALPAFDPGDGAVWLDRVGAAATSCQGPGPD